MNWQLLTAQLCTVMGWTWEYVEEHMTLPRLYALIETWKQQPPAAVSLANIARALGWKPAEPARARSRDRSRPKRSREELLAMFGGVDGVVAR